LVDPISRSQQRMLGRMVSLGRFHQSVAAADGTEGRSVPCRIAHVVRSQRRTEGRCVIRLTAAGNLMRGRGQIGCPGGTRLVHTIGAGAERAEELASANSPASGTLATFCGLSQHPRVCLAVCQHRGTGLLSRACARLEIRHRGTGVGEGAQFAPRPGSGSLARQSLLLKIVTWQEARPECALAGVSACTNWAAVAGVGGVTPRSTRHHPATPRTGRHNLQQPAACTYSGRHEAAHSKERKKKKGKERRNTPGYSTPPRTKRRERERMQQGRTTTL
jgi:hypothetical protein